MIGMSFLSIRRRWTLVGQRSSVRSLCRMRLTASRPGGVMPRSGRPKAELVLTDQERDQLRSWARRRTSAQALALRSRIVLGCAHGWDNKQAAARERVSAQTVGKWRTRFVVFGGSAGTAVAS